MKRNRNSWIKGIALTLLVLGMGAFGYWLGRDAQHAATEEAKPTTEESPVATVTTQPLEAGIIQQTVEAYGVMQSAPGSAINISVPFDSRIEHVHVAPGMAVDVDTPLVDVGPTEEVQLQLRQATEAQAAAARTLEQARRRLAENLATNADIATAEQAEQVARTQVESLEKRGAGKPHALVATIAGVVAQVNAQNGQVAMAGASLVVINPQTGAEAVVGVEPSDAALMHPGDPVNVRDVGGTGEPRVSAGTIRLIAQQINPQSRLRDVFVSLPEDAGMLQGQFVIAELTTREANGLIVPRSAVLPDEDEHVLFTIEEGKAKKHSVDPGISNHSQIQISGEDVHAGDVVIVTGNAELEEGMKVMIAPPTTQPAAEEDEK